MKKVLFVSILLLLCNSIAKAAYNPNDAEESPYAFNFDHLTGEATLVGPKVDNLFFKKKNITIPKTIKYLGEEYIVTAIEPKAFSYCRGITGSLTIPNSVISIGEFAFEGCSGLTGSLTIPNSVISIGEYAFFGCSGFDGSLTIGNSVTTIGEYAFDNCSGLTGSLTIGNSVTTIGKNAFYDCSGLTGSLTIPNSVTTIGGEAFRNCSSLTGSLVIPNSVTTIGGYAFYNCSGFDGSLTIPNSVTTIGGGAFRNCSSLTGPLVIPNSVTTIGDGAFHNCSSLTDPLVIPNSVTTIGNSVFSGCSGFNGSLTIPNSVTIIGNDAFKDCSGFKGSLTIPNSVNSIGSSAFQNCSGLTGSLTLHGSLEKLGAAAFATGSRFSDVIYPTSEPIFGVENSSFSDYSTTLYVYNNGIKRAKGVSPWNCFQNIEPIPIAATAISLDHTFVSLEVSETMQFEVIYYPENAYEKVLAWRSSNESVVKVDENGLVTAVSPGKSIIRATINETGLSASCPVTVYPKSAESISLDYEDVSMDIGETVKLTATVLPDEASDKSVFWASSNPGIASVDENGLVTAVSSGKATITVTTKEGGLSASCSVTVNPKPAESITLDYENITLNAGETVKLTATVLPDEASDKSVSWVSSNPEISSVDEDGIVTAISEGEATITATTNDGSSLTASCTVTVNPKPAGSITLDHENVTLTAGETIKLTATLLPDDAPDKSVSWASSDLGIASVDENGLVTAVSEGVATITATTNDGSSLTASCTVTVNPKPAGSITLDHENVTLNAGETIKLTATLQPDDAPDKSVTWVSSNPGIASVDENGLVTAISYGETTITATTNDGSELTASCIITVREIYVESITLNIESASIEVGETVQLIATVLPENASDRSYSWEAMDETIATVDENGLVTAVSVGQTLILASTNRASASGAVLGAWFNLTVLPKGAESITLDHENVTLTAGETIKLTATLLPDDAPDKSVSWASSDLGIASVDENGLVTAVSEGAATITATTNDGSELTASCTVTVNPKLAGSITLDHENVTLTAGETIKLTATVLPDDAPDKSVTWVSSDPGIASVDENGLVTAISYGETTITATTNDGSELTASCIISVREIYVESITLNIESATIEVGETVQLIATVLPENASDRSYVWESGDENIATIDENGLVTAVSVGETLILAKTNRGSASGAVLGAWFKLTVIPKGSRSITLDYENVSLNVGETVKLTATVQPDDIPDKSVSWVSSDPGVASVDENGLVTAVSFGQAIITATSNESGLSASCTVTVNPKLAGSITLDYENVSLNLGEVIKLTATVLPDNMADKSVSWVSSDPGIASVDENGLITAVSTGQAIITATSNETGLSASCTVTVNPKLVESITLDYETVSLNIGEMIKLTATVLPDDASDKSVSWDTSNHWRACVDENGMVTATSGGEVTITATTKDGSELTASCIIYVNEIFVESITLNIESASIEVGETVQLIATVLPENASDRSYFWKSLDETIAAVDENGLVTAVSVGQTRILACTNSASANGAVLGAWFDLTVGSEFAESITLDYENASLDVGETVKLTATVLPDDIPDRSVSWVSSDPWVASVDENGLVTAVSVGEATITATTNDGSALSASCTVTVNPTSAESITLDYENASLNVGETVKLTATVLPDDIPDRSVSWVSSDPWVASVDENGLVTAVSVGEATITATTNDGSALTASCIISVKEIFVESITLNIESATIEVGETVQLMATVLPENATDRSYSWGAWDETIATVDENGLVTAVSVGHTLIYAITNGVSASGPTLAAWFDLTVRPKLAESITLDYENVSLNIGETVKLTATVLPDNADNKSVIWSSSNPEIASVDEYGWVTAVTAGDAAITAATADGSDLSVDCNVSVLDPSGIQHICNDNVTITVVDGSIVIDGLNHGVTTALISLDGHFWGIQKSENVPVVYKAVPGIYIVRIGNQSYKVVVRP